MSTVAPPAQQKYTQVTPLMPPFMDSSIILAGYLAGAVVGIGLVNRYYGQPFFVASHLLIPVAAGVANNFVPVGSGSLVTYAVVFGTAAATAVYGLGLSGKEGMVTAFAASAGGVAGGLATVYGAYVLDQPRNF